VLRTDADSRAQLQELLDEQAALRRVATLVARDPDPSEIFDRVCAEVGGMLGVESTNLVRFEGAERATIVGGWGRDGAPVGVAGEELDLDGDTAVVKVSRSGRPERGDDYTQMRGSLARRLREVGILSAVAAPVTVAGKLWGAIVASSERPHNFPDQAEERIAAFAELVADALANADAREQLQRLLNEQAALRRVATLVARDPDPLEVFECVCEEIGTTLGIQSTNLTRFEGDGTQTVLAGWSAPGAPVFPVRGGVPLEGEAAVPKVSRSGRPERVDDYAEIDGELAAMIRAAGIASAVAAPITVAGKLWGAVVATTDRPYSFPPDTEERLAGFAELVAHAVANADAREQLASSRARIVEAADAERRRLERNLHDGAQQRLVSLALELRLAQTELDRDPKTAKRLLDTANDELALALGELRELARGIHPAILTDRGLGAALESLIAGAPFPVRLEALPSEPFPKAVDAAVYYLVAEGLTNAAKHARPSAVTVRVWRIGGLARIEISDDGVGGANLQTGSGLRGLSDRVEALGGHLKVTSQPGVGTTLKAELPLELAAAVAMLGEDRFGVVHAVEDDETAERPR
jgi:signal transduction histidine kinase